MLKLVSLSEYSINSLGAKLQPLASSTRLGDQILSFDDCLID